LAIEIEVKLTAGSARRDSGIAHALETAFNWNSSVPAERVQVKAGNGWVTLSGDIDWEFQRGRQPGAKADISSKRTAIE
jgi:osmotically-inducible protein OsmY